MGIQILCCWPGLAALWIRGVPRSLLLAVLFSWAVCLLLLATFVWPDWIQAWIVRSSWVVFGATWLASCVQSHLGLRNLVGNSDDRTHLAFSEAQVEYLKGNWFEAEAILLEILQKYPRDAEALLMLVGVLRRTQRWQPAMRRLEQLQTLDTAAVWQFEIRQERKFIEGKLAEVQESALLQVVSDEPN